jgi:hypothetical protein
MMSLMLALVGFQAPVSLVVLAAAYISARFKM